MSALGTVVRSGVTRRRVQTVVIVIATMMAVTASILGGSLLVASNDPFDEAFARQNGAHLSASYPADSVTVRDLTASASAEGVEGTAGPFAAASVAPTIEMTLPEGHPDAGQRSTAAVPPMTIVGRDDPAGGVDDLVVAEGEWHSGAGEIVIAASRPEQVGSTYTFPDIPGSPTLTVVGKARSATRTADAWVAESVIGSLATPDSGLSYQMLYRFDSASSVAAVTAGEDAVVAAVGAEPAGSQSWLAVREDATRETALFVPFLVAFGGVGLVMSVLIVGSVVAGAVGTSTRRIGILKSLGFTPAQVVRGYVGQALIPAVIGTALGLVAGNLLAVPVLNQTETAYDTSGPGVSLWTSAIAVIGILLVVVATALAAASRAGRLRTVDAIAVGRTSGTERGRTAARLAATLPIPRAVGLGLVRPFARPGRAAGTVATVAFGAAVITFTVGLSSSLNAVLAATANDSADVLVRSTGLAGEGPSGFAGEREAPAGRSEATADPDDVMAVIEAQSGTAAYYATARTQVTVLGMAGEISVEAFTGDASWGGYEMITGRWIERAGEVVVPTPFLTAAGADVGDTMTLQHEGVAIEVTIVGEVFDTTDQGKNVFTDAATFAADDLPTGEMSYHVDVADGIDVQSYLDSLMAELEPLGLAGQVGGDDQESSVGLTLQALAATLSLMLVTVAVLGVLNAVVLDTRERVREIGIHKALGMSPRQTVAMVVTSVVVPGLVGAGIGVVGGYALHAIVMPAMGSAAGLTLPPVVMDVYGPVLLVVLGLAGVVVAVVGSLAPAGWAARVRTATALRTE